MSSVAAAGDAFGRRRLIRLGGAAALSAPYVWSVTPGPSRAQTGRAGSRWPN